MSTLGKILFFLRMVHVCCWCRGNNQTLIMFYRTSHLGGLCRVLSFNIFNMCRLCFYYYYQWNIIHVLPLSRLLYVHAYWKSLHWWLNPFNPSVLFVDNQQTVQNQIKRFINGLIKSIEMSNWVFVACEEITKRHVNARIHATRLKHMKT